MNGTRKPARARLLLAVSLFCGLVSGWLFLDLAVQEKENEAPSNQMDVAQTHRLSLSPSAIRSRTVRAAVAPSGTHEERASEGKGSTISEPIHQTLPRRGVSVVEITSFHPRPANEWQGARVPNTPSDMPSCETSELCGLALACRDGLCGACLTDPDCAEGERCILDHCLLAENVECSTRNDCAENEVCLFRDDDSPGPRHNSSLMSVCWSREHPGPEQPGMPPQEENKVEQSTKQEILVDVEDMLGSLRAGQE